MFVRSPRAAQLAEVLRAGGTTAEATGTDALTVTGLSTDAVGRRAFAAGIGLHELRSRTSGLEEVYFQLTAGQEQFAAAEAGAGEQGATR
ncbi:hypothetical protein [Modestobacter sp. I12A-02662]|uniref:hypothetical protein n=1 Tax=Modestobacter sp. I12A-02662 TaxID=1730496 RepID=UPI0034DF4EE7